MSKTKQTTNTRRLRPEAKAPLTRIMIVDDHELLRDGLKELFGGEPGFEVCGEAVDEREALQLMQTAAPDLIIMDVSLKTGNGIDLVKTIKAKHSGARIIVLSMFDENLYAERALRAGAVGFISKQQPSSEILDAVKTVLGGGIYLSEKMTKLLLNRTFSKHVPISSSPTDLLSDRELEIFQMIGNAASTGQIAKALHLSISTVDTYRTRLKTKLNIESTAELVRQATVWVMENG